MNHELPDVQAGFRKGRGTRDQIANIHWIIKKTREFQKNIYFCFIGHPKAFNCVDHYKQSWWRWWNSSWAISNPKRWCFKVLHPICQQIWKTQQWPQDWKRSIFIPIPKKDNVKNVQTSAQLHLPHTLAKKCSKSPSQASIVHEWRTSRCSSWI